MNDQFEPDPETMKELDAISQDPEWANEPAYQQAMERAEQYEKKLEVLGRTLFHIPGTIGSYVEPESQTMWWKSPKGWHEHRIYENLRGGRYARLSLTIESIMGMAGCGES